MRLFATLRELLPKECRGVKTFMVTNDSTVDELFNMIGPLDRGSLILLLNGRRELDFNRKLKKSDRVSIFPPVGGG